ncbi:MAG: hypothetical protein ACRYFZ_20570 [Janthinobacterium lividum]
MQKLLLRLTLLLGVAGLLGSLGLWVGLRRGYIDAFYARFISPPAGSLVLGTSRAAQGIKPGVLAARLGSKGYAGPWLNYAFTLAESPYGPGYLSSIQRKLAPGITHGLFVLAVDPWSLSLPKEVERNAIPHSTKLSSSSFGNLLNYPEAKSMVSQLANVSQNPNLDYLAHYLHKPFYQLLLNTDTAHVVERLHPDGWLEIALPPPSADAALLRRRTAEKLATYRQLAATNSFAKARYASLWQTISFLQKHGQVVLVRIPTGPKMAALEQHYQPDFDQQLQELANFQHVPYLNYLDQPYPTNDGNHITRQAAEQFSQRLAADIAQLSH